MIQTRRLELVSLQREALLALLDGDLTRASRAQSVELTEEVLQSLDRHFLTVQLARLDARPDQRSWCARLMVHRVDGGVIGHCGFHGPPVDVGRAEIGYTVVAAHRRHGYATEAAGALVAWAGRHGEREVFASVSPANLASLGVVRRLGFEQVGTQEDEVDGLELVFRVATGASPAPAG